MKLTYQSPNGKLELGAFVNDETGSPTYFLTIFGKSKVLEPEAAKMLKQFLPDGAEHGSEIIECNNPTGSSKGLKKTVEITIKDALQPDKKISKNAWAYFTNYVVKVAEFVRQMYNVMPIEQLATPEAQALDRLLTEMGV